MAKQDYIVVKSSVRKTKEINVDNHVNTFGKTSHAFSTSDAGLAKEIETRYDIKGEVFPGDVIVAPLNRAPDPLHPRTFSVPEMPWKKKEREEREKHDNEREDGKSTGTCETAGGDRPAD